MSERIARRIYDRKYSGSRYREKLHGYEVARWSALQHFLERVAPIGNRSSSLTVLDYGAGSGLFVDLWKGVFPGATLHAVDVSSVALEQLVQRHPELSGRVGLVQGDRAPYPDAQFDVIASVEVLEHVLDLDAYLRDVYRLLKPGGVFVWTTPCANRLSIEHLWCVLLGQIQATSEGYRRWTWEEPTHVRRLRSKEARECLTLTGFRDVEFRFRAHFFSAVCSYLLRGPLEPAAERLMLLDYALFRRLPNGASMIGAAVR